jgi:hypothetical protein
MEFRRAILTSHQLPPFGQQNSPELFDEMGGVEFRNSLDSIRSRVHAGGKRRPGRRGNSVNGTTSSKYLKKFKEYF